MAIELAQDTCPHGTPQCWTCGACSPQPVTETITWHPVPGAKLPDSDITVMVELDTAAGTHSEPVWLGYLDGDEWRDVEGSRISVRAWAEPPKGMHAVQQIDPYLQTR